MEKDEAVWALRLSVQRSLVGEDRPNWAAVTCGIEAHKIALVAYVCGEVTREDTEAITCAGAEILADYPEGYTIEEVCRSLDDSALLMLDFWAYLRSDAEKLL